MNTIERTQSEFPCHRCGATLHFEPGQAALKCPYCHTENAIELGGGPIEELDYHAALALQAASAQTLESLAIKCTGCGAESSLSPNVTADRCPFCGAGIVASARSTRQIKPRSLLPFHIRRQQATDAFFAWLGSLWFAPGDLRRFAEAGSLTGAYLPYWTYDSNTRSAYTGQRGDNYTETQTYSTIENGKSVTKTRQVTKTRWTSVSGRVSNAFDDILIPAADTLPRNHLDRLEPWDLGNLVPYADEYLAGFVAESYQVDLETGFERAREVMDNAIRSAIRRNIGGDHQRIHTVQTQYNDISFKHILLPLWISAYRYRDRTFRFLVNARTGEVCGQRPWSIAKILLAILIAMVIIAILALIFANR